MITLELDERREAIEMFLDSEGIDHLISILSKLKGKLGHDHLFTESWGGHELGEKPHRGGKIVHHLRIQSVPSVGESTQ